MEGHILPRLQPSSPPPPPLPLPQSSQPTTPVSLATDEVAALHHEPSPPPSSPPLSTLVQQPEADEFEPDPPIIASHKLNISQQTLDWSILIMGFCLTSAVDIALLAIQTRTPSAVTFHMLCLSIVLAFSCIIVSKYITCKYPKPAKALEHAGVKFSAIAFFFAITTSLPLSLKLISWAIYFLSLLAIVICNLPQSVNI
ncbi:hypothetical protein NMG60_11023972 [Bertholletia excelsa]